MIGKNVQFGEVIHSADLSDEKQHLGMASSCCCCCTGSSVIAEGDSVESKK
jgi:hypothetical protein